MTNLKLGVSALVVAGATTALVVQHQAQIKLHGENESLQQQITQLHSENQQLSNLVAQADNSQSLADDQRNELLRLRDEVGRLRSESQELARLKAASAEEANDPMAAAARALLGRINLLKQRLQQVPRWNIPEVQYLPNKTWVDIALNSKLDTDEDVRMALCNLRSIAKEQVAMNISFALDRYIRSNNGQLPTSVPQIQPYFIWFSRTSQVGPEVLYSPAPETTPTAIDAILQRYQMLKTGNVGALQSNDMVLAEISPVDDQYDYIYEIGLTGAKSYPASNSIRYGRDSTVSWPPWQVHDGNR